MGSEPSLYFTRYFTHQINEKMTEAIYIAFLDYSVLVLLSVGMFIYAYYQRPETDISPGSNDTDGGIPPQGDTYPVDDPPSIVYPQKETTKTIAADGSVKGSRTDNTPEPANA